MLFCLANSCPSAGFRVQVEGLKLKDAGPGRKTSVFFFYTAVWADLFRHLDCGDCKGKPSILGPRRP